MKQVTQIPKEGLLSYLKEILLPYDLSGDTRSRLISSARHLVAFMEKRHLDFYNEDVGNFFTSTITLEKGVGARHYQRDCRMVKLLNSSMKGRYHRCSPYVHLVLTSLLVTLVIMHNNI